MKIVVLCPYEFPYGLAASTRILAYSKGLVKNGVEVEVLCFFPKVKEDTNTMQGSISGVKWVYLQEKNYNISKFRNLLMERTKVLFNTISHIRKSNRELKIDFVIMSFDNPYLQLYFTLCLRILGIKAAFIGDEYPKQIRRMKDKVPAWDLFIFRLSHKFLACRILMTQYLIDFYNKNVCSRPSYLLGSILDEDRFAEGETSNSSKTEYLCYMGNKSPLKDNLDNIISAFYLVHKDFPTLQFHIYGPKIEKIDSVLMRQIESLNLEDSVLIKGQIKYEQVPLVLKNARILVTSQPITKRAEGGFPTKMGEYMMCNRPMIVTNVGEIGRYVQDGVTAYIVPPCDPESYADKIRYILTHSMESEKVAERAYNVASLNYGCVNATKGLVQFFSQL